MYDFFLLISGKWGTVCDKLFSDMEARVVCRQLGYGTSTTGDISFEDLGEGSGMWLESVECSGDESRLTSCNHSVWGSVTCLDGQAVVIECCKFSKFPFKL